MKRFLINAAAGALALGLGFCIGGSAHARDYWNGSGYSLDHNFHSPFNYNFSYSGTYYGGNSYHRSEPRTDDAVAVGEGSPADEKWLTYCAPTREADKEGVIHLRYAHPGCEFGRAE